MAPPLKGIRVLDWTIWQFGPSATMMLADMGAEVIKIEQRGTGDPVRGFVIGTGERHRRWSSEANNRHKKSIVLDLKHPEARRIVYELVALSDVFVQSFRKGVSTRLGMDYAALSPHNPRLIYANATGFGSEGPDSEAPSLDYLGQARSGIMYSIGNPAAEPMVVGGGVADQTAATMLAYAIVTALLARERQGVGQELEVSHLGALIWLQGLNVACQGITGAPLEVRARAEAPNPLWNHYKCKDGRWIALGMLAPERYWRDFCAALGLSHLVGAPRFATMEARAANSRELVAILDEIFVTRNSDEWIELLRGRGNLVDSVKALSDLPNDPQVRANEYIVDYKHPTLGQVEITGLPVKFARTPGDPYGRAPELGEHTEQILTELLGYSWQEIARLKATEVI